MTVEIFNPQLSDFSADQLRVTLHSLMNQRFEMEIKKRSYQKHETLAKMFFAEIVDIERQIEDIDEIIVQFAGALQIKEKEKRVASN